MPMAILLSRKPHLRWHAKRSYSSNIPALMSSWQIEQYGNIGELQLTSTKKLPTIRLPDEVLIEVHAASVNPIDTLMMGMSFVYVSIHKI